MTFPNPVPLGQPLVGASFGQAVARFFRQYIGFSGRASRSEFWWAMLLVQLITLPTTVLLLIAMLGAIPAIVAAAAAGDEAAIGVAVTAMVGGTFLTSGLVIVVSLALTLPLLALYWRRLQDAGFHGAWSLLALVSLGIVPFVMACFPPSPAGVRFDPAARAAWGQAQPHATNPAPYGSAAATGPYAAYGSAPYGQPVEQPYGPPPASGPYDEPAGPYGQQR